MPEQFIFLRPLWLLLLLGLPLILWLTRKAVTETSQWSNYIDSRFLRVLQNGDTNEQSTKSNSLIVSLIYILLVLAIAGPSWEKIPQPVTKNNDHLVVILDLSLSMLSEDMPPSRLVRTKQKIIDLLRKREEGNTALVAFSGDSYVVTPLTDDMNTIESNLSALEPLILPVIGSRPDLAVDQAMELFASAGVAQGRILMFTDGVAEHQASRIQKALAGADVSLSVISVGTPAGGPIKLPNNRGYLRDQGAVVIPKTDHPSLERLAEANNGKFAVMSLNDSDLNHIGSVNSELNLAEDDSEFREFDQWEDKGYWMLMLALPLCLIAYRRGAYLLVCLFIFPENSYAFEFKDLWLTQDQQAQNLMIEQEYEAAANTFQSTMHKADALYRNGNYDQAAELYEQINSAEAHYNRGNALARSGDLDGAISAYEQALQLDSTLSQAADNKALIEQLKQQQQQQQQQQQGGDSSNSQDSNADDSQNGQSQNDGSGDNSNSSQQKEQNSESSSQSPSQESAQASSEEQASKQSEESASQNTQNGEQGSDQTRSQADQPNQEAEADDKQAQTNDAQAMQEAQQDSLSNNGKAGAPQDSDSSPENQALSQEQLRALEELSDAQQDGQPAQNLAIDESLSSEEQKAFEQWMRRVPDDPSGLLRRKFEQQSRQRNQQSDPEEPLW